MASIGVVGIRQVSLATEFHTKKSCRSGHAAKKKDQNHEMINNQLGETHFVLNFAALVFAKERVATSVYGTSDNDHVSGHSIFQAFQGALVLSEHFFYS